MHDTLYLSTSDPKFGTSALYGENSGELSSTGSNLYLDPAKDFTVEAWMKCSDATGAAGGGFLFDQRVNATLSGLFVDVSSSGIVAKDNDVIVSNFSFEVDIVNQYQHVALSRKGDVWYSFIAGRLLGTYTKAATAGGSATLIGASVRSGYNLSGFIDEWRLTIGVARYTTDFTPPSAPFSLG